MLTRVCSNTQLVLASLTGNTKEVVLSVSCFTARVLKIHSKSASFFRQAVNFVQAEPKFTIEVPEAAFVVGPAAEEINRAVQSLLEHCPPPTGCCLVTVHIKGITVVGFDRVNTANSPTNFVEFCTIFVNCKRKRNIRSVVQHYQIIALKM